MNVRVCQWPDCGHDTNCSGDATCCHYLDPKLVGFVSQQAGRLLRPRVEPARAVILDEHLMPCD